MGMVPPKDGVLAHYRMARKYSMYIILVTILLLTKYRIFHFRAPPGHPGGLRGCIPEPDQQGLRLRPQPGGDRMALEPFLGAVLR